MLENYERLENGVVRQINRQPFQYGFDYSNAYNNLGESVTRISFLRLGYLLGAIKTSPRSILDVGYGNGSFIKLASTTIDDCYASDVSNQYPVPENVTYVESIYDDHFDVITMFDVLEHFDNIYDIVNLKCNYLYVSMPWCHYHSDDWFHSWKHRKPDEHLWHFNDNSLRKFMKEVGFETVCTSNIEDLVRTPINSDKNILSGIFRKI